MLMVTDNLRASSNFTVAAEWKTTETHCARRCWSAGLIPSSGSVMSPLMGTIFSKSLGLSSLTRLKS